MSLSIHTAAQKVFWSSPKSSNAWAWLYCCLCWQELLPCGYTHCFAKCNGESLWKGTCVQLCQQTPHTAGADGFLLDRCSPEGMVSNLLLLQRAYMENTDQEMKLLDKPSTELIQLVKNIKDISTAVSILPSTSWPASSAPLP